MPTSTLVRLGFAADERVVIFHADDLGMCHSANAAFADIVAAGVVNCGSIMVPCPWFNEIAIYARSHPEADLGVHLTLNSEWHSYRWGPLSTRDPASGLLDEEGYLWRDVASLHAHVDPAAAEGELHAQVERALAAGINLTHIDTHMGAVVHPQLVRAYLDLAQQYTLALQLHPIRQDEHLAQGAPAAQAEEMAGWIASLQERDDVLLLDRVAFFHSSSPQAIKQECRALLRGLPAGLTHLVYHPAQLSEETEAIMGADVAACRMSEWQLASSLELAQIIAESGVRVIGYRALREALWA